jgi:serine/threonine-protein kinase HipA
VNFELTAVSVDRAREGEFSVSRRKGLVKLSGQVAGLLEEVNGKTKFTYAPEFLAASTQPISLTMPLRPEPYWWNGLHPFFDNLLYEGWMLDMASKKLKIPKEDRFGLLLATCGDCAGAVEIEPLHEKRRRREG